MESNHEHTKTLRLIITFIIFDKFILDSLLFSLYHSFNSKGASFTSWINDGLYQVSRLLYLLTLNIIIFVLMKGNIIYYIKYYNFRSWRKEILPLNNSRASTNFFL